MSDRTRILTVVLDKDIRTDDAQALIDAIGLLAGVISVKANISNIWEDMAIETAKYELREKLRELLR